ncbi:MAG: hypothetical protein H2041_16385 [Phenylobacterium sp.]|uniref:hypothetical protein n=1 Tax=Phenylobacterium sp. TaxID=1871053 RepID=UPI0017D428D1|nr:hypothetical protein [Phenylobacterium sp.]MBA4795237.1 hypothetical protein [Phenylobacterium sp.]
MTWRLTLWASLAGVLLICGLALYLDGRADASRRLRAEVAAAQSAADRHALEAEGERDAAARVAAQQVPVRAAERIAAAAIPKALNAEDANAPLDPDRADRLRLADRQLCAAAPALEGCAAALHAP